MRPNAPNDLPNADPLPPHTNFTFGPFDATNVPTFNDRPSGLEKRTGYNAKFTNQQVKKQLIGRPTTFLLGRVSASGPVHPVRPDFWDPVGSDNGHAVTLPEALHPSYRLPGQ